MKDQVSVSVIVPIYNAEDTLRPCLEGLASQGLRDIEFLLCDDGSTDRSREIALEYAERDGSRFRLVSCPHGGVSSALNHGLEAARGAWIGFCDSDDVAESGLYGDLLSTALRHDADLSCCAMREYSSQGERVITTFPVVGEEEVLSNRGELLRRIFLELMLDTHRCFSYKMICLFRQSVIADSGLRFPLGVPMREDEIFLLRFLTHARRVVGSTRVLYRYMRREGSLCQTFYGRWNAFEREEIWVKIFREQLSAYLEGDLGAEYAWLEEALRLRLYLHEAHRICCDPSLGLCAEQQRLRELAQRARHEGMAVRGRGKLFWLCLLHFRWLLPSLLWGKRLSESLARHAWRLTGRRGSSGGKS